VRVYDSATVNLGILSRHTDDLNTARPALRQAINRARDAGDDHSLMMFLSYLAGTEVLAAAWYDWPRRRCTSSRVATC
jgi:Anaphase-promoting complex subunit 5